MAYANASIKNNSYTGTSANYTLAEGVSTNDLIFVQWAESNASNSTAPTITDQASNNYAVLGTPQYFSTPNQTWGMSWLGSPATYSAGTYVLSLTSPFSNGHWCITHWTGFTNTVAVDTTGSWNTPFNSGVGTAVSGSGTTGQSTELVLGVAFGGNSYTLPGAPWNNPFNGGGGAIFQIVWQSVASPSAVSYAGTIGVSEQWVLWLPGFYSASGGGSGVNQTNFITTVGAA